MLTKQEKGGTTTGLRSAARRAKIGFVVCVLVDRNRTKPWKWIRPEAARLCGARATAVAKMREAVDAYSQTQTLINGPEFRDRPIIPADFDLERWVREVDEIWFFTAAVLREKEQIEWHLRNGQWPVAPGMLRGRKRDH